MIPALQIGLLIIMAVLIFGSLCLAIWVVGQPVLIGPKTFFAVVAVCCVSTIILGLSAWKLGTP